MSNYIQDMLWHYPSPYLTDGQAAQLFGGTAHSKHGRLKRAVQQGVLIRLKRGFYLLGEKLREKSWHPFEAAQFLYGPSYISLESALAYHGLIPEAVRVITSVTINRTKHFQNSVGYFQYYHLPEDNFFVEVVRVTEADNVFFIASPWKALFDYMFCYKKSWKNLEDARDDLRLDLAELPLIEEETLSRLKNFYHQYRLSKFIDHIKKEMRHES